MSQLVVPVSIDVLDHVKWARSVARGVREYYGFFQGSQEERDLEGVAYLMLLRKARQFDIALVPYGGDPHGAFRGWLHPTIRCYCRREAARLLNGGTHGARADATFDIVGALPAGERRGGAREDDSHEGYPFPSDGRRPAPLDALDEMVVAEERERADRELSVFIGTARHAIAPKNVRARRSHLTQRRRFKPKPGKLDLRYTAGGCSVSLTSLVGIC